MEDNIKMVIQVIVWKDVDSAAKLSLGSSSFKHVMYKMQHFAKEIPHWKQNQFLSDKAM
jgi:hypothetical protein